MVSSNAVIDISNVESIIAGSVSVSPSKISRNTPTSMPIPNSHT